MISLKNIYLDLGGQPILKGVDLQVNEGECIAMVGPNGCGKSTLLRLIAGRMRPDSGEISLPTRASIGYLPQEANLAVTHSLEKELSSAFDHILEAFKEMTDLEHRMATTDTDSAKYTWIMERYGELSHLVEHQDGYSFESEVSRVAAGLGFKTGDMERSCQEFSGGWKMRILLAKLLLEKPDIILLDEPTNHLDLESMLWLENWIRYCKRTVIMVSHERAFMDRLVERIVCLELGQGDVYRGNYSNYLKQSAERRRLHQEAYERQQKEIEQMEAFIRRFRYNAARASLVQSRVKQLERIEKLQPPFYGEGIHFTFPKAQPSYREVVTLEDLEKSYGDLKVFSGINLTMYRGEKVGLVGPNGAGKSTLMRIIAGREEPTRGRAFLGGAVKPAYFAQEDTSTLSSEQTLLEAIEQQAPVGEGVRARGLLGAFLFSGDDVNKPLSVLSGGERTRFRMAQMLFCPANLLIMDEPTNHLDVTSRATVERALKSFTGTVIVVSHDQVFMDRVTDRIIEIKDGAVRTYPGKYSEYLDYERGLVLEDTSQDPQIHQVGADNLPKVERKQGYQENKARNRKLRAVERKLETLEKEIAAQESLMADLDRKMNDPKIAADYSALAALTAERQEVTRKNLRSLEEWEAQGKELDSMRNS